MAVKYGNDIPVADIVYGTGEPVRKIVEFVPSVNGDILYIPNIPITFDLSDTHNIYPPVPFLVLATITNVVVVNATNRQIDVTINFNISFYDPDWLYNDTWETFRNEGVGIYYKFGNDTNWHLAEQIPFNATQPNPQGYWVGGGNWQHPYNLTQAEWEQYGYQEVIVYQENDTYKWVQIDFGRYDIIYDDVLLDGPQVDFALPPGTSITSIPTVANYYYPPTKIFNNKTLKARDELSRDFRREWVASSYNEWVASGSQFSYTTNGFPSPENIPLDVYMIPLDTVVEVKNPDLAMYAYYRTEYNYSFGIVLYFIYQCNKI